MDKFEKILRDKLQHHEAAMPNGAWEQFSQRLDGLTPKPSPWKSYLAGGLAAATIGVGAYFLIPSSEGEKQNTPPQTAVENTISENTGNKSNPAAPTITFSESKEDLPVDKGNETVTAPAGEKKTIEKNTGNSTKRIAAETKNLSKENDKKGNTQEQPNINKTTEKKAGNSTTVNNTNENKGNESNQAANTHVPAPVQLPEPEISGNITEVCQNIEMTFKAANARTDHDLTWVLNGEEISADAELKVSFSKPGTQTLQLVYATVSEGKRIAKESEKRFINVLPAPLVDIEVNKMNEYSPEYMFKAPAAEGNDYLWNFGDGRVQTGNDLMHVYRKKGEYTIALTITGSNGCKARKAEKVEIENDYNLLAPNSFTPNGDGLNDVFIPEALKVMTDSRFRMIIFDKSGKKIFETTRLDNPWDGRNSTTSTMCPPSAYVWRVELTRPNGTREEYMGSVTIVEN